MRTISKAVVTAAIAALFSTYIGVPVAGADHIAKRQFRRISADQACQIFVTPGRYTVAAYAYAFPGVAVCVPPWQRDEKLRATTGYAPNLDANLPHPHFRYYDVRPLGERMIAKYRFP